MPKTRWVGRGLSYWPQLCTQAGRTPPRSLWKGRWHRPFSEPRQQISFLNGILDRIRRPGQEARVPGCTATEAPLPGCGGGCHTSPSPGNRFSSSQTWLSSRTRGIFLRWWNTSFSCRFSPSSVAHALWSKHRGARGCFRTTACPQSVTVV